MASRSGTSSSAAEALAADLRRRITGQVHFDPGARALYAQDASHYHQTPIGVVVPRSADEVEATIEVCRQHEAPVLLRGGGTSLAGQGCNVAVVLDLSRHLNRIIELDPGQGLARVEPGVLLDDLRDAAEVHGLTFGPDPSTHAVCTLGGMIGNNACGVHSQMAGRTSDNVEAMRVLTYDGLRLTVGPTDSSTLDHLIAAGGRRGQLYAELRRLRDTHADLIRQRYPRIPRRVSGYNLDELLPEHGFHVARALVGSEGTCATVLEATVKLVPSPPARTLVVLGYADVATAGDDVAAVLEHAPIGLEGMADSLVTNMRAKGLEPAGLALLPPGRGWLMVEFGGATVAEANDKAQRLVRVMRQREHGPSVRVIDDRRVARAVWEAREAGVGASSRLADGTDTFPGWEDAAVPPERLGDYLRDLQQLLDAYGYRATVYGHFGQGCVHARIDFDLFTDAGIARYAKFIDEAADLVVQHGGSLSGEHGDGHSRAALLTKMFGSELIDAFRAFKTAWDPDGRMNPGKVVDPLSPTEALRYGAGYRLPQLDTHFVYPDDRRHFARAVSRCVGVGKCRRESGGTMCPSYKATRDEQHTTRGRARLLQEMTEGRLPDGWGNEQVRAALDLCLSCKGCKRDCPAGVDVATYKAEFLSHHYEGRRRPRQAYAFGLVHRWARLASMAPRLANATARLPGLSQLFKLVVGMAPQRTAPRFASQTFRQQFARRDVSADASTTPHDRPPVLLWPDTFNDHFRPEVLHAAVSVLEQAGFTVRLPAARLCCGRPLYDFGMLDQAKRQLRAVLEALRADIDAGVPMVGLEPSCVAVFRDELVNLFPDDAGAVKLSGQTYTLAELLTEHAPGYAPPALRGRAIFHGHCHQKAIMGMSPDVALLRATGLEVELPDTGCCGMAGSFGFHRRHYDLSMQIGEQVLLPLVRAADSNALVVTDGFSCREQIEQATGRRTLHLAQVLAQASRSTPAPHAPEAASIH